jgi:hypothetical protein
VLGGEDAKKLEPVFEYAAICEGCVEALVDNEGKCISLY